MPSLIQQLQTWYRDTDLGRAVFDWASKKGNPAETTVEDLARYVRLSRQDAVLAAKELARAGCGTFVSGRHGKPSRIRWIYTLSSIGAVAAGTTTKLQAIRTAADWAAGHPDEDHSDIEVILGRAVIKAIRSLKRDNAEKILAALNLPRR